MGMIAIPYSRMDIKGVRSQNEVFKKGSNPYDFYFYTFITDCSRSIEEKKSENVKLYDSN